MMETVEEKNIETPAARNGLDSTNLSGGAELNTIYSDVFEGATSLFTHFVAEVKKDVISPLSDLATRLASTHASILEELEGAQNHDNHWEFQRSYREKVETSIIEPLQAYLEEQKPGSTVNRKYFDFLHSLQNIAGNVPSTITIPEPASLYAHDRSDAREIALRKLGRRIVGKTRDTFGAIGSLFGRERTEPTIDVPVGEITQYHVRRRLPASAANTFKTLHGEVARRTAIFEAGVSSWFHGVLNADREMDRNTLEVEPADTTESGEESVVETDVVDSLYADVIKAAHALQYALEAASDDDSGVVLDPEKDFAFAWQMYQLDLEGCGTFVSPMPVAVSELGAPEIVGGAADSASEWTRWHKQVIQRLVMINTLIDIRDEMLSLEDGLIGKIVKSSTAPLKSAFERLSDELEAAYETVRTESEQVRSIDDLRQFATTLKETRKSLLQRTRWLASMPGFIANDSVLESPGNIEWRKLLDTADGLPEELTIHPAPDPAAVDPRAGERTVKMRETFRQTLHLDLPTRLKPRTEPFKRELVKAWGSTETLDNIIIFNIDAALEEIDKLLSPNSETESSGDTTVDQETETVTVDSVRDTSFELAGAALQRADDSIDETIRSLDAQLAHLVDAINMAFLDDWTAIHKTIRTRDDATGQWAEMFTLAGQRWDAFRFSAEKWLGDSLVTLRQWIRAGERSARGLIRKGQTAVGVLDQSDKHRALTVDTITGVAAFKKKLPVVYRRLFSFDPLSSVGLAEARSRDLVWVRSFATGWKERRNGGVAIIAGAPGSGKTSFLNILPETSLKEYQTDLIRFANRPASEAELAMHLAETLAPDKNIASLSELENHLEQSKERRCVLIDDLEHLFLQASEGKQLLERFMLFLSRNDRWVFWLLSIGSPSWKYLTRTSQRIVGFVAAYELSPLDRAAYESIIMNRHQRSGLPLVFEQPRDSKNYLKDKLGPNRTEEEVQNALRETYFETLRKVSGQNIMLALFYWTLSVEFREEGDLMVKPINPLSFDFLTQYDTGLAFSLRSIIVHKTLSVEEHNRIFNFTRDETTFMLERLVNDRMICLVDSNPDVAGVEQPDWYRGNVRFRVHPLVLHPVVAMLSRNNLLH